MLGIDTKSFENDYKVKTMVTSMVQQIPEIKQQPNETVVQYFSKALKIMTDLKSKINPNGIGYF